VCVPIAIVVVDIVASSKCSRSFVVCHRTIVNRVTCWGSHERIKSVYQTHQKIKENKRTDSRMRLPSTTRGEIRRRNSDYGFV
jgi:hypothetical protein